LATTNAAQSSQALLPEPWWEVREVQSLINGGNLETKEPKKVGVIRPRPGNEGVGAYLVYHINKGLSIVSTEVTDHLDFVLTGEDCLEQRDDFIFREVMTD